MRTVFDARSAQMARRSGWERYTAEIAQRLEVGSAVTVRRRPFESRPQRLLSDIELAWAGRHDVVHYPTLPPLLPRETDILTVHDLTFWRYPETCSRWALRYYRPLLERAIPRAARIVTHSLTVADEIVHRWGIDAERVTAVYCGADSLSGVAPVTADRPRPFFLAVGTLEPRKNFPRLAAAFAASGLAGDFDLVLVGRLAWGEVPRGVHVLTDVTDAELLGLYGAAHAVVVPSLYEGFGLPVVEAVRHGRRLAVSDIPVFREVTEGMALSFDPESVSEMIAALHLLAADSGQVTDALRTAVSDRYTWDAVVERLLGVYAAAW